MPGTPLNLKKRSPGFQLECPQDYPWHVLVVDDDPEVHEVTRLMLGKFCFRDRGLQIWSALSTQEALKILEQQKDIAVILLDVVMETDDAGLELVKIIRRQMNNKTVRIILRTGQPGQAPEEWVIVEYDINDYKTKTELTSQKLFTSILTALRSYEDITALERNRLGLEKILHSSDTLFKLQSLKSFASGVLSQLSTFMGATPNGILCVQRNVDGENQDGNQRLGVQIEDIDILAATGSFEIPGGSHSLSDIPNPDVRQAILRALETQCNYYSSSGMALYIPVFNGSETVAYIQSPYPLDEVDIRLLEVFLSKISVGFINASLYEELEIRVAQRTEALAQANRELERLAATDPLTGCYNRRYFFDSGERELVRAKRYNTSTSILMMDIDRFKKINDTYGHAVGDEILKGFVKICKGILRSHDVLGRIGGEEFAVLLPHTGADEALIAAERLRLSVEQNRIANNNGGINLTVSIGVACVKEESGTVECILKKADHALYEAKREGRNRVKIT